MRPLAYALLSIALAAAAVGNAVGYVLEFIRRTLRPVWRAN